MWNVLMAAGGFAGVALLSGVAPLCLAGKARGVCLLAAAGVNGAAAAVFWNLDPVSAAARIYLMNLLLLTAVTDLKERQIYDLHFYALVLGGAVSAFFEEGTFARYALFLLLLGVLFGAVAGIMVYIAVEELIPSSRQYGHDRPALWATLCGICVMPLTHLFQT